MTDPQIDEFRNMARMVLRLLTEAELFGRDEVDRQESGVEDLVSYWTVKGRPLEADEAALIGVISGLGAALAGEIAAGTRGEGSPVVAATLARMIERFAPKLEEAGS